MKILSALEAYDMSAVTAVVAQNARGVRSFQALDADFIGEQLDAMRDDVRVDPIKIGLTANAEMVAQRIDHHELQNVVLDPGVAAKSSDSPPATGAIAAVRDALFLAYKQNLAG